MRNREQTSKAIMLSFSGEGVKKILKKLCEFAYTIVYTIGIVSAFFCRCY